MTARRRRCTLAALCGLAVAGTGCGLIALSHDAVLGPVSPVGEVHEASIGRGFHVTPTGPEAEASGEARLRPYPPDIIRRLGSPGSFRSLLRGIEAVAVGLSFVVERREASGLPLAHALVPAPGATIQQVLDAMGAPGVWVRLGEGSLMAYRHRAARDLAVNLGIPPLIAGAAPVPGLANLSFRYSNRVADADGVVLFFDREDRLVGRVADAEHSPR